MGFFLEAAQMLGIDYAKLTNGYQIINYNGEAVYIEGARRVISITDTVIALDVGKSEIFLRGANLFIFDITGATVMIKGKIECIEILGEPQKISAINKVAKDV